VIVVDNASTDGSSDMVATEFPETILIRSTTNLGFSRANNLGIQRATGSIIALINSDVIVHPGCFPTLAKFLDENPKVGLTGPKVFGRDGKIQLSCGRLPNLWNTFCRFLALDKVLSRWSLFSGFEMRHLNHDRQMEVEVLSGCFWVARREAVDKVGGLDERFFFYAEDWDWCKRFRDANWKVMYVPEATATHFGGGSSSNAPLRYSILKLRANLTYWKKHYGTLGRAAYYVLSMLEHTLRLSAREILRLFGRARTPEAAHKLEEHKVCLRWLMTGKGV